MKRRAERQEETRRRIIEAAVDLHTAVGPAQTTVSMIAARAGVQRHTYYSHFPEERDMLLACSGHAFSKAPPPDAGPWRAIKDSGERLTVGLRAIYDWYAHNEGLLASVLRDAEHHELTREINNLRFGPYMSAYRETLGARLNARQRAMLALALSFYTWKTLSVEEGLKPAAAVKTMMEAIAALE